MIAEGRSMGENAAFRAEDVLPVRSRVSWGAIFAGGVIACAVYLVLTMLGAAIGLSVSDNIRAENLATGAAAWAIAATMLALFIGGCVTSQCTVGENKMEAIIHGILMWGVVFAVLLWLVAVGIRSGFSAMVGIANASQAATNITGEDWEAAARRAGVPQKQIDDWRSTAANAPEAIRRAANDPQTREAVAAAATKATWWSLVGTLLSIAAAIGGALFGAGPSIRLLGAMTYSSASFESRQAVKT